MGSWESERLIGGAIEAAPIAFSVLDRTGRYLAVNGAASRITGYSRSELVERTTADVSADPESTLKALEAAFRSGAGAGLRDFRRKDGSLVRVEYRLAAASLGNEELLVAAWWPLEEGPEEAVREEVADAAGAESASLSAAQARVLGLAFHDAPIAVTVADGDGNYLALNERACEIAGFTRTELFELGAWGIVVSPRTALGRDLTALPGIRRGSAEIRCKDGTTKTVAFRAATTTLGSQQVRIGVWWEP